jgi:cysteine sulfinate desulfinase/cysteine desulfurase-like protein
MEFVGSAVRFSLGPDTTDAEVDAARDAVGRVLARVR